MMIVDESTTIKTHNAKRTKTLLKLSENIGYKRILTGTPVTKSPLDIFITIRILRYKEILGKNYYSFRARYAKIVSRPTSGGRNFPLITGYQRLDELEEEDIYTCIQSKKRRVCRSTS